MTGFPKEDLGDNLCMPEQNFIGAVVHTAIEPGRLVAPDFGDTTGAGPPFLVLPCGAYTAGSCPELDMHT